MNKRHYITVATVLFAFVGILSSAHRAYAINDQNDGQLNGGPSPPSARMKASRNPRSEEELRAMAELLNKNPVHGWVSLGTHLPREDENGPLRGLKTVQLQLVGIDQKIESYGLSQKAIEADLESELKRAGIEVLLFSLKFADKNRIVISNRDTPILQVVVAIYKPSHLQLYSYACELALFEHVCPKRNEGATWLAKTWWIPPSVGMMSDGEMPQTIGNHLRVLVQKFVSDHVEANQKGAKLPDSADGRTLSQVPTKEAGSQTAIEYTYVASKSSNVFHRPDCRWAKNISPNNLVSYSSRDEAIKAGKKPCKSCKP